MTGVTSSPRSGPEQQTEGGPRLEDNRLGLRPAAKASPIRRCYDNELNPPSTSPRARSAIGGGRSGGLGGLYRSFM